MSQPISLQHSLRAIIDAQRQIVACGVSDLGRVMAEVVERAQQLTGASAAAVELREGDEMVYRAASGSAATALGLRLKIATSLSGRCLQEKVSLICHDTELDPRVDRAACQRIGVRSMLVVPLRTRDALVGVLKVMSAQPGQFDEQDADLLDLMAGLIAEAMAQAHAHEEASRAEAQFESSFAAASIGMALVSLEGRFIRVNDALCGLLGYERGELVGTSFSTISYPEETPHDLAGLRRLLSGELDSYEREKRYVHKHGHIIWTYLTAAVVRDSNGSPLHLVSQLQDITGRKLAEAESRAFFELSPDLLAVVSRDMRFEQINAAWTHAFGYTRAELIHQRTLDFIHPDDRQRSESAGQAMRNREDLHGQFRNRFRRQDGAYRWLEWSTKPALDGRLYCIARDVTSQVERESELTALASLDGLTGLPNRRYFDLTLERACAESDAAGRTLSVLLLDIDHFKSINDEHGHAAGDEVLRRFAKLLRACLREVDSLARWGGEEFAVLVRSENAADVASVAERIRRTCHDTEMVIGDPTWRVSVSIGMAERRPGQEIKRWLERADQALYSAKRSGRNRVCRSDYPAARGDAAE